MSRGNEATAEDGGRERADEQSAPSLGGFEFLQSRMLT